MTDQLDKLRAFTIHGRRDDKATPLFIGWGMEYPDIGMTLYYNSDASRTPDRLLEYYQGFAEVRFKWVDTR
jgi:hypothetical protein